MVIHKSPLGYTVEYQNKVVMGSSLNVCLMALFSK